MDLCREYLDGASIPELAAKYEIPQSTLRKHLVAEGVKLRSRAEGARLAVTRGRKSPGRPSL